MTRIIKTILPLLDVVLSPFVLMAAVLLKFVRRAGVQRMPLCKAVLMRVGVFPIQDHYYEPLFNGRHLRYRLDVDRHLPGIDWNVPDQLHLLSRFNFNGELLETSPSVGTARTFAFNNGAFESGDAEYWYNLIRLMKPARIIEIGSGHSTLMAQRAIRRNREEASDYRCEHVCIEPYEMPWLEQTDVRVIRQRVEAIDPATFLELQANDVLFIDSSHIIRPQGDVLYEYLEVLPALRPGVIVHIHDIFSPRDYPSSWLVDEVKLWNEQYILEAFLSSNAEWKVIGALNFLHHHYYDELKAKSPFLKPDREPGSFYIQKVK